MTIVINYTPRTMTTDQYDQVIGQLDEAGLGTPAGRKYHVAYTVDGSMRVIDVFESPETFEAFAGQLAPVLQGLGVELERMDVSPVHAMVAGSSEGSRNIGQRFADALDRFWRSGNPDELDAVFSVDFEDHTPGLPPNLAGLKQVLPAFQSALTDFQVSAQEVLSGGDRAVSRVRWQATHTGDLLGIRPTGRRVTVTETHVYRLQDGRIAERWGQWDQMGLMQQLGVVPDLSAQSA